MQKKATEDFGMNHVWILIGSFHQLHEEWTRHKWGEGQTGSRETSWKSVAVIHIRHSGGSGSNGSSAEDEERDAF